MDRKNLPSASAYRKNNRFLAELRKCYISGLIDKQELMTFRGQALKGDRDGAIKGLAKLIAKRRGF